MRHLLALSKGRGKKWSRKKRPRKKGLREKMREGKNGRRIKRNLTSPLNAFFCVKYPAEHALKLEGVQGAEGPEGGRGPE